MRQVGGRLQMNGACASGVTRDGWRRGEASADRDRRCSRRGPLARLTARSAVARWVAAYRVAGQVSMNAVLKKGADQDRRPPVVIVGAGRDCGGRHAG